MFETTTPKGTEGFNISYSEEVKCAKALRQVIPKDWKIVFSWAQILFSDVQYEVDKKKKKVNVVYNQNLRIWQNDVVHAVKDMVCQ